MRTLLFLLATVGTAAADGSWTRAGDLSAARGSFVLVVLADGRVLAAGGAGGFDASGERPPLASAELFDPATGRWRPTASLHAGRSRFAAALLDDGRVLVIGGSDAVGPIADCEIYDPASETWTAAAPLGTPRHLHGAARLHDGSVLAVGGISDLSPAQTYERSAERYDPATNRWS